MFKYYEIFHKKRPFCGLKRSRKQACMKLKVKRELRDNPTYKKVGMKLSSVVNSSVRPKYTHLSKIVKRNKFLSISNLTVTIGQNIWGSKIRKKLMV